jgi:hypothetical protein
MLLIYVVYLIFGKTFLKKLSVYKESVFVKNYSFIE